MPNAELSRLKEFLINYRANLQRTVDEMTLWLEGLDRAEKAETELVDTKDDLAVFTNAAYQHLVRSADQKMDAQPVIDGLRERGFQIGLSPFDSLSIRMPKHEMNPAVVAYLNEHTQSITENLKAQKHGPDQAD